MTPEIPKPDMLVGDDRLDRMSAIRKDPSAIAALWAAHGAAVALFDGPEPIFRSNTARLAVSLWHDPAMLRGEDPAGMIFLGCDRTTGAGRFATHVSAEARNRLATGLPLAPPEDLRSIAARGRLPAGEISAAAMARSVIAWHGSNRFCGACGSRTRIADAGWRLVCEACPRDLYPRVDPVVIMLVTDGERCVLAHEPRFPERMYSCIAGFVEPGEDAAHAVRRETAEEIGLSVGAVEIVSTQPWPFPHALMIGCIAAAASSELTIDPVEIETAAWFTRAEARAMLERRHPGGLWVPGSHAIAHHLIARFAAGDP